MAAASDDDRVGKSTFRCLDAVRYVVASVVVVLIVAVIVKSIMIVLRPDSFDLYVVSGTVIITKPQPQDKQVQLQLHLRASNPNSRVRLYFTNVTGYLLDKNKPDSTLDPAGDSIIFFSPPDQAVPQMTSVDYFSAVNGSNNPDVMNTTYFKMLYYNNGGRRIDGVTLRVEGSIITEIKSGYNRSARPTTYYCRQLVVGGDLADETSKQDDVRCAGGRQAAIQ